MSLRHVLLQGELPPPVTPVRKDDESGACGRGCPDGTDHCMALSLRRGVSRSHIDPETLARVVAGIFGKGPVTSRTLTVPNAEVSAISHSPVIEREESLFTFRIVNLHRSITIERLCDAVANIVKRIRATGNIRCVLRRVIVRPEFDVAIDLFVIERWNR